jgi:hypothetical protein
MTHFVEACLMRRETSVTAVLLLAVAALLAIPAAGDFSEAVQRVDPAVVTITVGEQAGSGFIVSTEGHIVTNSHVVEGALGADIVVKLQNGESLKADLQHTSANRDLAVVKVDRANLPIVQFASSEQLTAGQDVAAVGAPLGLEHSVTRGVISALSREIDGNTYLQIDAALNEGNSGGPIINDEGQVVGVAVRVATEAQNVGFAIPSLDTMTFLQANEVQFNAVLGDAPAAPASPDAGAPEEPAPAPDAEQPPAAEPAPDAPAPAAPAPATPATGGLPGMWILWTVVISFVVSALVAVVVSMIFMRSRGPSGAAGQQVQQTGQPVSQPAPEPQQEEDLSDIDIDLH